MQSPLQSQNITANIAIGVLYSIIISACYICTDNLYGESVIKKCEASAKRRRAADQILVGLPVQNYAKLC